MRLLVLQNWYWSQAQNAIASGAHSVTIEAVAQTEGRSTDPNEIDTDLM
nr:MAG TPA: hypothetical protein [Caudoviricetes sp.]